ncbi:MAG: QueT transporter family protein [Oscillospiraceae bacterium]|nr:QueT transporter family protein [Oscillospiraceae bacterium]
MSKGKSISTSYIAQGALIAASYVVITVAFAPISFGSVQFRVSEALTILPMFTPAAVPGLFLGCLLANLLGGAVFLDILFGSIATLIGAALGRLLRSNRWLVPIPAVITNSLIIPLVLKYGYGVDLPYLLQAGYIAVGEILGCYVLGEVLASILLKRKEVISR